MTAVSSSHSLLQQDQKPSILIADKNPVVRTGLSELISTDGRFSHVTCLATGGAFISACMDRAADVGLIGWVLPDMTGGDVLDVLKRRQIKTRVVIYTGEAVSDVLRQTIKLGGWGFISKSDEPSLILDTLWAVARGRLCFPYVDFESLSQDPLELLTSRERELLAALANGWSNLQIAARIGISRNTVKYHLKNLYDKLGVNNRASAVALYMTKSSRIVSS
ncbi:MAG: response regulator transcription factor [Hyphomicrobium sp.]